MESNVIEIYSGFTKPLLPFHYVVILISTTFPLAAFVGFKVGTYERHRLGYDKLSADQLPGATSLSAMLALLGLLLGFAFNSAINWREDRQSELVKEANAISTAFLTASLLAEPGRTALQEQILAYGTTRIATADDIASVEAWNAFLSNTMQAQAAIWPAVEKALSGAASDPIRIMVVQNLTQMLDAHNLRVAAAAQQIPLPAKLMISIAAISALAIVGNRSALHGRPLTWRTFALVLLLAVVIIVIFDLDRSLEGTMRVKPDTLLAVLYEIESTLTARRN
ncbi:MAG: hypothetical protein V2I76_14970 [Roseobacter sp.]|jgi:hypothetical protein|nr:hypothetical protein [Roseobacter sp.]